MIEKNLDASILFSLLSLTSQIRLRGDLIYKFVGITTQQYMVMLHLASDPNIPFLENHRREMLASELATSLKISRPGITNILKMLIEKNLVQQIEDKKDRRQKRLRLTENGARLIKEVEPIRHEANRNLLEGFSDEEKDNFLDYIRRCSDYAREQLKNPDSLINMHENIYDKPPEDVGRLMDMVQTISNDYR
ncbi:MAG: MarR family transcriptional regulator [Bacteroidota bacterium]